MKIIFLTAVFIALLGNATTLIAQTNPNTPEKDKKKTTANVPTAQPFVLKGRIHGMESGALMLYCYYPDNREVADTATIHDGQFEFKGKIDVPMMAYIVPIGDSNNKGLTAANFGVVYIEPGNMDMEITQGDFSNLKLKGSKTHQEYRSVELQKKPFYDKISAIDAEYKIASNAWFKAKKEGKPVTELKALADAGTAIKDKEGPVEEEMNKIEMKFISQHPDSYYAAIMLWFQKIKRIPLNQSKAAYANFSDRIVKGSYGKAIGEKIKGLQGGSPGVMAPTFSSTDINGEQLSLADYRGKKYVLLDFWATWCVPCRKGNPHLLSLYSKYKDKGLEIIGISDDDKNIEGWKKAVETDKIGVWKHILMGSNQIKNGADRSNNLGSFYSISYLPTKILIDKNGVIIGRYGAGGERGDEAMDKKLEEIFN